MWALLLLQTTHVRRGREPLCRSIWNFEQAGLVAPMHCGAFGRAMLWRTRLASKRSGSMLVL